MGKILARLILVVLAGWGLARFTHHQTAGLRMTKFTGTTVEYGLSPPLTSEVKGILNQPFTYFGRGLQSFAFASEDGKYVLKLFNNKYQRRLFWLNTFMPWKKERIAYNEKKLALTYQSYAMAFEKMREETGLAHLQTRAIDTPLTTLIVDMLNITHRIDLSKLSWALQRRATPAYDFLRACSLEEGKEALHRLFAQLKKRMDLGIGDRDPNIRVNLGFNGARPLQIDIGPFFSAPELKNRTLQEKQLESDTLSLKHWIENNYPDLLDHFYEAKNSH